MKPYYQDVKEAIKNNLRLSMERWNAITVLLKQADAELGTAETNRLIRECKLVGYGWIERLE